MWMLKMKWKASGFRVNHSIIDSNDYYYAKYLYLYILITFVYTAEPCQMNQAVDSQTLKKRNKIKVDDFMFGAIVVDC